MLARASMLLKSRASMACFRACFLPGRAKDLSAPWCIPEVTSPVSLTYSSNLSLRTDTHSFNIILTTRYSENKLVSLSTRNTLSVLNSFWLSKTSSTSQAYYFKFTFQDIRGLFRLSQSFSPFARYPAFLMLTLGDRSRNASWFEEPSFLPYILSYPLSIHVTTENVDSTKKTIHMCLVIFFYSKKKSDQYYVDLACKCATTSQNSAYHRPYTDKKDI